MRETSNKVGCSNCGQGVQGILVTFPDAQTRGQIQGTLSKEFTLLWKSIDETKLWFRYRFLCDCLPYWQEFYDLSTWHARWADLDLCGTLLVKALVSWSDLIENQPRLFVTDVLEAGTLRMMMQPIVDVGKGTTIGYEMLARGVREDGSIISPGELYSSAREQNQLFRLDRACRLVGIEAGSRLSKELNIFINFVPTSIYAPEHCLASTMDVIERLGLSHERIVFEVVETDRVEDLGHLRKILSYYRNTGFRCALDDFGEGYNDEGTLQALLPDIVKLDRKYVTDIHLDADKQSVAKSIYKNGRAIGATMLAEGIECEEEAVVLARLGYQWQQGYWFGRPHWEPVLVDEVKLQRVWKMSRLPV